MTELLTGKKTEEVESAGQNVEVLIIDLDSEIQKIKSELDQARNLIENLLKQPVARPFHKNRIDSYIKKINATIEILEKRLAVLNELKQNDLN